MISQLDLITPAAALGRQLRAGRPVVAQFDEKVSPSGITRPLSPLSAAAARSAKRTVLALGCVYTYGHSQVYTAFRVAIRVMLEMLFGEPAEQPGCSTLTHHSLTTATPPPIHLNPSKHTPCASAQTQRLMLHEMASQALSIPEILRVVSSRGKEKEGGKTSDGSHILDREAN